MMTSTKPYHDQLRAVKLQPEIKKLADEAAAYGLRPLRTDFGAILSAQRRLMRKLTKLLPGDSLTVAKAMCRFQDRTMGRPVA